MMYLVVDEQREKTDNKDSVLLHLSRTIKLGNHSVKLFSKGDNTNHNSRESNNKETPTLERMNLV